MYRIDRMRRDYERFTAAEGYAIGFNIGNDVYCAMVDKIPRRWCTLQRECSRNGGSMGLYLKSNKKIKNELLRKGAVKVGTLDDVIDKNKKYNKGVMFEKLVYKLNGQVKATDKDAEPFYKKGDITIDGKEIQVKYGRARICYDSTLTRLKKEAKAA